MIVTSTTHIFNWDQSFIHPLGIKQWEVFEAPEEMEIIIHPSFHPFIHLSIHPFITRHFFLVVQYRDFPSTKWFLKIYYIKNYYYGMDGVLDAKTKCHTYNFVAINDAQLDTSHGCELIEVADPLLVKLLGGGFRSRSCLLKCLFTINRPFHLPRTTMFKNRWRKPTN